MVLTWKPADFLLTSDPFRSSHGKPHSFHADQCPHSPLLHTSIIGCSMTESSCHGLWYNPHITGDCISSPKDIQQTTRGPSFIAELCCQITAFCFNLNTFQGRTPSPTKRESRKIIIFKSIGWDKGYVIVPSKVLLGQHVWRIQELRSLQENVISVEGSFLLVLSFEEIFSV